jgi:hypothetical protein
MLWAMAVKYCYLCNKQPPLRRSDSAGLEEGDHCPICHQPVCRPHLSIVRWRWRESGETDAALVCKECARSYAHRTWDTFRRDWIT